MYEEDLEYQKLKAEFDRVAEKADAAKAKQKAKLDRWKARKSEAIRKHDAKRKIVGGGFLYKLAADGDENARAVMRKLQAHLNGETARASDKKAFEDWKWPERKTKTQQTPPVQTERKNASTHQENRWK